MATIKKQIPPDKKDGVENKACVDDKIKQPVNLKDIDQNSTVIVRNGFQGCLVYKSSRTGELFTWDAFEDEQEMDIRELRNAKSSKKKFFINNWFMFDKEDDWVIDYLGLSQYYRSAIKLDEFDKLFAKTPSEITKIVSGLSKGQKQSVIYKARQSVINGEIDSRKAILALEKSLGVEIIEK